MKSLSALGWVIALGGGLLAGCGESATTAAQQAEAPSAATEQPEAPRPPPPTAADTPASTAGPARPPFAAAPPTGLIVRANCHMGACTWNRFVEVERGGSAASPTYRLRIAQGESQHPGDYPAGPDGVDIAWDNADVQATVACSHAAPHAAVGDQGETLKLNPQGVAGVSQALANLYFSVCHGEYGNDAELAAKYGYDLR